MTGRNHKWYVVYTRSQHEKKLQTDLKRLNIESYLPLVPSLRIWSDRVKKIETPLFPNYLFVRIGAREYSMVLDHPSVIDFIRYGSIPAEVDGKILVSVMAIVDSRMSFTVRETRMLRGDRVVVTSGPLAGLEGVVRNECGHSCLIMEIAQINQSFFVKIDRGMVLKYERPLRVGA